MSDGENQERPFVRLASLPPDLADAFESFKLAILRHRFNDWTEVSQDDVLMYVGILADMAMQRKAIA